MAGRYTGPSALSMAHRLRFHGARALSLAEGDPVRALGLTWYDHAAAWCRDLAARYHAWGATFERVAGAIAALSPQVSWLDQTRFTGPFLESVLVVGDLQTLPHPGFLRNRIKARDILLGRGTPQEILGGPKVTAFFDSITGDINRVCVDRHAATVALGERVGEFTNRTSQEIQAAYVLAARWLGVAPRDLQSLIWCDHKARGATADDAPTQFEARGSGPTLTDLALGWADDPDGAFYAPVADPTPDPSAPLLPCEV